MRGIVKTITALGMERHAADLVDRGFRSAPRATGAATKESTAF
jgi:hypothetical protein